MAGLKKRVSRREFLRMGAGSAGALLAGSSLVSCAGSKKESVYKNKPEDHINLATWYTCEEGWPKKPAGFGCGAVAGVAVDGEENVWVFTRTKPPVQVYNPEGKLIRSWGDDLVKTAHYMKIDKQNNIWIADCGTHLVRKCSREGKVLLTLGTEGVAGDDKKHFNLPTDMAVLPNGEVFVSDGYGNNRIVHFDAKGRFIKQWGKKGVRPGEFHTPHCIQVDSTGRLYVADRSNSRVQVFDYDGKYLAEWRDIMVPWGIWISDKDDIWICGSTPMTWEEGGEVFGCPPKDQLVIKFNREGKVLQISSFPKGKDKKERPGELNWVHGIALDSKGNLYLGDIMGKRIQKFVRHTDPKAKT